MGDVGRFLECFSGLTDPRQRNKVLYPLPEVLLLLLAARLAGSDDFVEICWWGERQLGFLRRFCPYKNGIPSHDTLGDLLAVLKPAEFRVCFSAWVDGLRADYGSAADPEIVAIDGKTSRRSHDRAAGRGPLHLL